jgi:hypothetical protein
LNIGEVVENVEESDLSVSDMFRSTSKPIK